MKSVRRHMVLVPFLCLLLSACTTAGDQEPSAVATTAIVEKAATREILPTPGIAPAATTILMPPTPLPSPRPSPTLRPSSTPLPIITLSVPESWKDQTERALSLLNETADSHLWHLVEDDQADVHLIDDSSGIVVAERALALAVPFTMDWESVPGDRAQAILNQGHESVSVVPWPEMQRGHKALRIDGLGPADSGYPLIETWSLVADDSLQDVVQELAPVLQETYRDDVIHLAAVGDIMLDRSLGYNLSRGSLDYPFISVAERLRLADITVGNMESALGNMGDPQPKRYPFRAPPEAADALSLAGFDVVSLANNHGMDYGEEALLQGLDLLQKQRVLPVGAGPDSAAARAPQIVGRNGLQTAILAYVNVPVEASTGFDTASWTAAEEKAGIAWGDPQIIAADIAAVRDNVDLVVVLLHSGFEYQALPSEPQTAAARAAIDAGADLVIGHHAHILQGIEYYRDGVILYGTGNFAFDIDGPPETAIFHMWLDKNGVREIAVEPAIIQFGGQPRLAASWEAPAILSRLYYLTEQLTVD